MAISMLAFYSGNPSSNPAEVNDSFSVKLSAKNEWVSPYLKCVVFYPPTQMNLVYLDFWIPTTNYFSFIFVPFKYLEKHQSDCSSRRRTCRRLCRHKQDIISLYQCVGIGILSLLRSDNLLLSIRAQCDQNGRIWEVLGNKFSYKIMQNFLDNFEKVNL